VPFFHYLGISLPKRFIFFHFKNCKSIDIFNFGPDENSDLAPTLHSHLFNTHLTRNKV